MRDNRVSLNPILTARPLIYCCFLPNFAVSHSSVDVWPLQRRVIMHSQVMYFVVTHCEMR